MCPRCIPDHYPLRLQSAVSWRCRCCKCEVYTSVGWVDINIINGDLKKTQWKSMSIIYKWMVYSWQVIYKLWMFNCISLVAGTTMQGLVGWGTTNWNERTTTGCFQPLKKTRLLETWKITLERIENKQSPHKKEIWSPFNWKRHISLPSECDRTANSGIPRYPIGSVRYNETVQHISRTNSQPSVSAKRSIKLRRWKINLAPILSRCCKRSSIWSSKASLPSSGTWQIR